MKSGKSVVMLLLLLVSSSAKKSYFKSYITLICFPTLHLSLVGL